MGGMEICGDGDPNKVPVVAVRGPGSRRRDGKGKKRAVEGEADMLDFEEGSGSSREATGICPFSSFHLPYFFFFLLFSVLRVGGGLMDLILSSFTCVGH